MLADGTYDAIVVEAADVEESDDTGGDVKGGDVKGGDVKGGDVKGGDVKGGGCVRLELTIVAGPHKGDVVAVRAEHLAMTAVETLGLPARLVVTDQRPEVVLET